MDIRFIGKNLRVTEGMKEHLTEKLQKLGKYAPRLVESHVVLKKERYLYEAEITLLAKHFWAYGEGRRKDNIYAAIDQAYARVEKQLKKFREKIKNHHKGGARSAVAKIEAMRRTAAAIRNFDLRGKPNEGEA